MILPNRHHIYYIIDRSAKCFLWLKANFARVDDSGVWQGPNRIMNKWEFKTCRNQIDETSARAEGNRPPMNVMNELTIHLRVRCLLRVPNETALAPPPDEALGPDRGSPARAGRHPIDGPII